ncbi:MAG: hypothetical protein KC656_06910 [Myxococcales bacterium]|nr:hypothetical protein [Myxococcales bacterium]MCB9672503.1 hypothetical protein [Alphaproteobacteria bacterium]MCB9691754.1 hypothetical protein [Alphaproteobacteria bacterium]
MLTLLLPLALGQEAPIEDEAPVSADTGVVEFDSRLPAEIQLDGHTLAQLYQQGTLRTRAPTGTHEVVVLTNGRARSLTLDVSRTATAVVFIGRNGLTASTRLEPLPEEAGEAPVELRVLGHEEVLVTLGDRRFRMLPGSTKALSVPLGRHEMSVKSASGTVLWAKGHLELTRTTPAVIQITEGRMPEVSGAGTTFVAGS